METTPRKFEKRQYAMAKAAFPVVITAVPATFSYSDDGSGTLAWRAFIFCILIFACTVLQMLRTQQKHKGPVREITTISIIIVATFTVLIIAFFQELTPGDLSAGNNVSIILITGLLAAFASSFLPDFPEVNSPRPYQRIKYRHQRVIPLSIARTPFLTGLIGGFISAGLATRIFRARKSSRFKEKSLIVN